MMSDFMNWEPIEDCPAATQVMFLFDHDNGNYRPAGPRQAVPGFCTKRGFANPIKYYIGFEINDVEIRILSEQPPVAFAHITLPDFLSDEAE